MTAVETRRAVRLTRSRSRFRIRLAYFAPVFAFLALTSWAFASPVGAGPDDDYHLVSIWCANGGGEQCKPGSNEGSRMAAWGLEASLCYVLNPSLSAACQDEVMPNWDGRLIETSRGNFIGEYPPLYYGTMRLFAGSDLAFSALVMRLVNAALFVGLVTTLAVLLPKSRRTSLLWGWLVALVPLGMFLIPSNNPSGWAITGVGTAFLALLGWFEVQGVRRWVLGALYLVGVFMAAGARGDAAIYAVGASVVALILTFAGTRVWLIRAILPATAIVIAVAFFAIAGQSGVAVSGFTSGGGGATIPVSGENGERAPLGGFALAAYNLLMLPLLWTGVWGSWGLGWLDTILPAIVPWAATAAFIVVGFAGLARMNLRKAIALTGVFSVLVVLPVYVLTVGNDVVGANLQPRYLLPVIILFSMLLVIMPDKKKLSFTRLQTGVIFTALVVANLVALQINIRRYVTGAHQQGFNLDAGAEWWWSGLPIGPMALWLLGALAYAATLVTIFPQLRPEQKLSDSAKLSQKSL